MELHVIRLTIVVSCHWLVVSIPAPEPRKLTRSEESLLSRVEDGDSVSVQRSAGDTLYYMTHACERSMLKLSCPEGFQIFVTRASFGRHSARQCNYVGKTMARCTGTTVKNVLGDICNGGRECEVPVMGRVFGNPCPGVYKYVEAYYSCVTDSPRGNDEY